MTMLAIEHLRRRGACPGLSAPMPTGDGLLVRLLPIGTISLDAFDALCAAAKWHGNGVIEITARGSIQVRGLSIASAPLFAEAVAALNINTADGIPVLSNALSALAADEILDASALAADLRRALADASFSGRLAPKVSVVIDGGGTLTLDNVAADVRLHADVQTGDSMLRVGVGGDDQTATWLGYIAPARAVEAAVQSLEVIMRRGRSARARDVLAADGPAAFRSAIGHLLTAIAPSPGPRQLQESIGLHRLRNGSLACGIGLAFGHAVAWSLQRLIEAAHITGANGMRTAPGRALLTVGLAEERTSAFAEAAARLGFIVRADDARRNVIACPGAPICSSAHIPARGIAPLVSEAVAPHVDPAFTIHISGCAKGCAHAGAATLTIVGFPHECAVIANGSVRDPPLAVIGPNELPAAIARHARALKHEVGHV